MKEQSTYAFIFLNAANVDYMSRFHYGPLPPSILIITTVVIIIIETIFFPSLLVTKDLLKNKGEMMHQGRANNTPYHKIILNK